jgi:hypothetical protein
MEEIIKKIFQSIIVKWIYGWASKFFLKIKSIIKKKGNPKSITFPIPAEPFIVEIQPSNCEVLVNRENNISKIEIWINLWGIHFEPVTINSVKVDVSINNGNFIELRNPDELKLTYSCSHQLILKQDLSDKQERRAEQLFYNHEYAYTHLEFTIRYEINGVEKIWSKGKNVILCWKEFKNQ